MEYIPGGEGLAILLAAVVGGLVIGFLLGNLGNAGLHRQLSQASDERARANAQARDHSRLVAKMRSEQRTVTSMVRNLPGAVRELNRSDLDPRRIPDIVVNLATSIFEPEQVLLYLVGTPDGARSTGELRLRAHRGLRPVPKQVERIAFGEGKVGWVADNKVDMAAEDWLNLSRTDGRSLENNHPALKPDLISPLVHHGQQGAEHLLGVLSIGAPSVRPRDEKLMLQMVTNLGSIALINTLNVAKLRDKASHDGLTGLLNKRKFMEVLGGRINEVEGEGQPLSLYIFDIDHFKRYNDTNGHLAGDELLKAVPRVLRDNLRAGDIACRYGGEEFIVAMPETDKETAFRVADRVRQAIEAHPFPHRESQPGGKLTVSGGVASFPVDGRNTTELIGHADQALYKAKSAGRNRVMRYRGLQIGGPAEEHPPDDSWPPVSKPMGA